MHGSILSPTGIWALVDIAIVDFIGLEYASNLGACTPSLVEINALN